MGLVAGAGKSFAETAAELQLGTRLSGLGQAAAGSFQVFVGYSIAATGAGMTGGSYGASAPVSIPLVIFGAAMATNGVDNINTGLSTVWNGDPGRTLTSQSFDVLTQDPVQSDRAEFLLMLAGDLSLLPRRSLTKLGPDLCEASNRIAAEAPQVVDYSAQLTRDRGNATRSLRQALNTDTAVERPHHIITWETKGEPVVQAAARGGFNINGANNGVNLQLRVHPQGGRHPRYNNAIEKLVDKLNARNLTDAEAATEVQAIADRLRPGLERLNERGQRLR
jgi:hypothetical protein